MKLAARDLRGRGGGGRVIPSLGRGGATGVAIAVVAAMSLSAAVPGADARSGARHSWVVTSPRGDISASVAARDGTLTLTARRRGRVVLSTPVEIGRAHV